MSEDKVEKKVGRPSMAQEKKKHISASMYLTREEHDHFTAVVKESGLSVSNFIRRACADHINMQCVQLTEED